MRINVYAVNGEDDLLPLVTYELPELDEIAKKDVVVKEGSTKPKVSLNFELTRSHLFKLNTASVSVDEKVIEEIIVEMKEEDKKEEGESSEDLSGTDDEEAKEDDDEANGDEGEKQEEEEAQPDAEETDEPSEEDAEAKEEEPEVEKEYSERIETHTFTVEIKETLHGAKLLNDDQIREAKKRLKNLERRDDDKKMTDEAKNSYESLIYEFRGFLRDDDNFPYVKEEDREELITKTEDAEDWLYDAGSDVGFKVYQEKSYEMMTEYTKYKNRKEQA